MARILVVGAGASGACVTRELCDAALATNTRVDIDVVDKGQPHLLEEHCRKPQQTFFRGVAYSATAEYHLLNIPTHGMSAVEAKPDDFAEWLQAKVALGVVDPKWVQWGVNGHAPRRLFGDYLNERTNDAIARAAGWATVNLIAGEVRAIAVHQREAVVAVHAADAITLQFDYLILCHGNLSPPLLRPLRQLEATGHGGRFVSNPWGFQSLDEKDATVGIIGTRLTAIDYLLHLRKGCGHSGKILFFSRTGQFPKENPGERLEPKWERLEQLLFPELANTDGSAAAVESVVASISLEEIARRFRVAVCGVDGDDGSVWQGRFDAIRPYTNVIWKTRSSADRTLFLSKLRCEFEIHRHRVAPNVLCYVESLFANGTASHVVGHIDRVARSDDRTLEVTMDDGERHSVNWLINCTGPDADYRDAAVGSDLIRSLRDQNAITPEPHGIAMIVDGATGQTATLGCGAGLLFAVGPPRRGLEWETIALKEIRQQSEALAKHIVDIISGSK